MSKGKEKRISILYSHTIINILLSIVILCMIIGIIIVIGLIFTYELQTELIDALLNLLIITSLLLGITLLYTCYTYLTGDKANV